jgi:anti-sigma-K factor RskA
MSERRDDASTRAASYAVGALTAAERRNVEQELRRSPRLAAEVSEFSETAAMLGLAVEPVTPDAALRDRLLGAVEATPQEATVVRGPWFSRPAAVLLGAAAAVVIAIGGTTVALNLTREPSAIEQITAAADYERVVHEMEGGASVTAVWSASLQRAALIVEEMDAAPSGHVYQAWLIGDDGHAAPDVTFNPDGDAPVSLSLAGAMHAGDAIGITIEPTGGSDEPTTPPILVIETA